MSQFFESPTRPDTAAGAIAQHLRVKTTGALVVATATDVEIGTMDTPATAAGPATVRLRTAEGTRKMVALTAITKNNPVYAAAGGKVAATGSVYVGTALEAAAADNDVIEVLPGPNTDVAASTFAGSAKVSRTRVTLAQINAGHTVLPAITGYKYRMQDMALIAVGGTTAGITGILIRGTQGGDVVKLMDGKIAGLARSVLLRAGTATNGVILADGASFAANDVSTAITVIKDGSDLSGATHIDVLLTYTVEA
jgi:hypothetical protein